MRRAITDHSCRVDAVGNTKLICEAVAGSNISIPKAQPAQTAVQSTPAGVD